MNPKDSNVYRKRACRFPYDSSGVEYRDGRPYSINIRPLRGHAVATHPANCPNHDFHDVRIGRIGRTQMTQRAQMNTDKISENPCYLCHPCSPAPLFSNQKNHIKITVQTNDGTARGQCRDVARNFFTNSCHHHSCPFVPFVAKKQKIVAKTRKN